MNRNQALIATVLCMACAGGSPPRTDGGNRCTTDNDCNDGHECTLDACGVDMACRYTAVNELCTGGQLCEVGRGCVTASSCTSDTDCADAHECTIDTCVVGGVCNHTPISARCTAPATCDAAMGCVGPMGCTSAAECNDDIACTIDTCAADMTCRNTPEDSLCTGTGEVCSATSGCFVPRPCTVDMDCDDGNLCNGREFCIPEFGCQPAPAPETCADVDACTVAERCDAAADMCAWDCNTADPSCNCPVSPPDCNGTFALTPAPAQRCACLFGCAVDYDFATITMTASGVVLDVRGARQHFTGGLTDNRASACPNFRAVRMIAGACTETYTLEGTFSDADHFTGMWTATFTDGGSGGCEDPINGGRLCNDQSVAVTGTRR